MTSGKRTPETVLLKIRQMAAMKNADHDWRFSKTEIATRFGVDIRIVEEVIRDGNRKWQNISQWVDDLQP